jgi:hypothetical protein
MLEVAGDAKSRLEKAVQRSHSPNNPEPGCSISPDSLTEGNSK